MLKIKLKDLLNESMIPITYVDLEQLINQFGKNKGAIGKLLEFKNNHVGETIIYEACINIKASSGKDKIEVDVT